MKKHEEPKRYTINVIVKSKTDFSIKQSSYIAVNGKTKNRDNARVFETLAMAKKWCDESTERPPKGYSLCHSIEEIEK